MTKNLALLLALLGMLAACGDGDGTNPVNNPGSDEESDDSDLPPGTSDPTADDPITRYVGEVNDISYDTENDTFYVNNLGFDGANVYQRDDQVASLGPFSVYEAQETYIDPQNGNVISQLTPYRAIYGVSPSGRTEFAVVRTGAYTDFGFGGFVYSRNGSVTLPTSGQGSFAGSYAGLRDFANAKQLEYTTGTMALEIDFDDPDGTGFVKGGVFDRRVYDLAGNDITTDIMSAMGSSATTLPTLRLPEPASSAGLDAAGEFSGTIGSVREDGSAFESGNYYAVIAGDDADEIVGVIVVEGTDPRYDSTVRETGGFILAR